MTEATMPEPQSDETTGPVDEKLFEHLRGVRDSLSVGRVFSDPVEIDGVTVIPVGRVAGGGGGGSGEGDEGAGSGSGFGLHARAVGVYELRDGTLVWKPAVDVDRMIRGSQVLCGIALVCFTILRLARTVTARRR